MTAYEAMGGEAKIRAVLQKLYDALFDDPIVGFLFEGKDKAHLVEQQLAFTCAFLGGPQRYTGRSLPEVHSRLPLLPGHFDRRHWLLRRILEGEHVVAEAKNEWLRIDESLRPSVLAAGEAARAATRADDR